MPRTTPLFALVFLCTPGAALLCSPGAALPGGPPQNVLLVVLDDVGVYDLASYGEGSILPVTPRLDALAAEGVLFRNAWANPTCSPTRATLLTGRYSFRTGVGKAVSTALSESALSPAELLLPELLPAGYSSGLFGKWHLSTIMEGALAPNAAGFDHFAGHLFNITGSQTYWSYQKVVDGLSSTSTEYATSEQVDDTRDWIERVEQPWFGVLSFTSAHDPLHCPPPELLTSPCQEPSPLGGVSDRPRFLAMIEAIDAELGRLLDSMDADVLAHTIVIVVGDNGPSSPTVGPPLQPGKAKLTVYEGGVRVPLFVWGSNLPAAGAECAALVNTTDVFATILELVGAPFAPSGIDSVSFARHLRDASLPSRRTHIFAERFLPNGVPAGDPTAAYKYALRDAKHKLHRSNGVEALYDLSSDPLELQDLAGGPHFSDTLAALGASLDGLLASPGLAPDAGTLSLSAGGALGLAVHTGPGYGGLPYLILGSLTGTAPGIAVDGVVLPLVADAYLDHTLLFAGTPAFAGTVGALDPDGAAAATIVFPAGSDSSLAGQVAHHAALVFGPSGEAIWASDPVALSLGP